MALTRRPVAFAAAVATATALGATVLALPALAADPVAAPAVKPPLKIVGGTLDWGVVQRYRDYVTGVPPRGANGTITVADGAKRNADGTFNFGGAEGAYDRDTHIVKAAFDGSVTFSSPAPPQGHGFEVKLSDFQFDTGTQKLTADVTKGAATKQDVPLADVKVAGPSLENLATTLTKEAAEELGGPYEGIAGDPLTVKLEFEQPTTPKPTPTPTVTVTQQPTPTPKPTAVTSKPAEDGAVLDGTLTWGLKESFRKYIQSGGEITATRGATKNGDVFDFSFVKADLDARELNASFTGSVRFAYAAHGINMTFSDVRIETAGAAGTLVLDVTTSKGTKEGVKFATLDLSTADYTAKNGIVQLKSIPAAFTADGAAQFANDATGSMYKKGDPLDPVTLSLALDKDADLPDGGTSGTTGGSPGGTTGGTGGAVGGSVGGNLAATGAEVPAGPLLAASGAIVAAGAAVVFAARRRRPSGA
ncbi:HtaA domain-containing protein [Streptomyces sp. A3M-1-3]|uniref:HtaA domain-containing protein n=1 Tax=Streptomyces sp. A3M-1-3 TaxID=2962044 RepID=UPI0020B790AE|nr:HtaA domain-containing protein [Streptomyces sp. A3M-1-3]MCP3817551.1 HtaA domain-containing protein [Streptomyces sp. A3M-1-3]